MVYNNQKYTGVRDLVCWLDLYKELSLPIVLQFPSVHASPQFLLLVTTVTSH
jgi:hypothetical protein